MKPLFQLSIATLSAGALAFPLSAPLQAQAPVGAVVTLVMPAGDFGSTKFTDLLVNTLGAARGFCGALDKSYQVDCLAERLGRMASDIPEDSDYAEVKQMLDNASREMEQLARSNRDSGKPRASASAGGSLPQATTRPLTPVSAGSIASVNEQAAAILDRTQTMLLRSPDDEGGKSLHYARIADAIGSNKTLLRSA